jgi:hypothetical protein
MEFDFTINARDNKVGSCAECDEKKKPFSGAGVFARSSYGYAIITMIYGTYGTEIKRTENIP